MDRQAPSRTSPDLTTERIYCNSCKQITNHEEKFRQKVVFSEEQGFHEYLLHSLLMCMGCEEFVLRRIFYNDETSSDEEAEIRFFPKRLHSEHTLKPYSKLNSKLSTLYKEAITCFNERALILCAAGLRALLEGICQDKKIKGRNLKVKIDGLRDHLPNKNIVKNLHQFRFMGNEAVHELEAPKAAELALAISVIEDLLSFFYELDYKASQLRDMRRAGKTKMKKTQKLSDSLTHWADAVVAMPESVTTKPEPELP
jgi:hypothetical protein